MIDFGLAKATDGRLTDRSASTKMGVLLGTPAYMAPEQADPRRPAIGPAADVYALGVVLYELLAGRLPFDPERLRHDPVELVRILREEEPRSLSSPWTRPVPEAGEIARRRGTDPRSLRRLLRGELSWIVHRCLEKDPRRRYPSARALADDIERHLTHRPVEARPPRLGYRAGKLVRRHRTATSAVAAALATLALAAAGLPFLGRSRERAPAPLEQVTTSGLVRGAGISPSGRYVLYHERSRGNESVLWLVDRDTGALERLPDMPGPPVNSEHRFSRDERFLYVKSHGKGKAQALHRLALGAGEWEDLWSDPPEGATISPDETRLAGVRNDPARRAAGWSWPTCAGGSRGRSPRGPWTPRTSSPAGRRTGGRSGSRSGRRPSKGRSASWRWTWRRGASGRSDHGTGSTPRPRRGCPAVRLCSSSGTGGASSR